MERTQIQSDDQQTHSDHKASSTPSSNTDDLKGELERLSRELAAAQQERSQSAAYGLELLNEKENLQHKYESIEALYEQSKQELREIREAYNRAVTEQRVSETNVFEKEVQLLNDSDALAASFNNAKQEIEKELKQIKSQLDSAISEKDRYLSEREDLAKKVSSLEQERKALKTELKDLKGRETRLFNENSELEEENVSLQKQVSNLRSTQVEFESSKHEIQRLHDEVVALNSQLEEMVTLKRITERQMQEALEALQSEREQKYALRKELDKRNTTDPLINWTSLAALKGSPHLANLALRGFSTSGRDRTSLSREGGDVSPNEFGSDQEPATTYSDADQNYDMMHDLEMPSIEGSLFDEVHLTEIKKLQHNLEEKENQRSNLNTKFIEVQHKLESKIRQADEIQRKLISICTLVEEFYNESDLQKLASPKKSTKQRVSIDEDSSRDPNDSKLADEVTSTTNTSSGQLSATTKSNILDDYDNIHAHLQALFSEFKSYQEICALKRESISNKADISQAPDQSLNLNLDAPSTLDSGVKIEAPETLQSDDVKSLQAMLNKKHEQLKQLRTILKSNKESAEVALKNLKSKYDMEKAIVTETMNKLRLEHKRLSEDAATFASLRSQFSARIEEYNTEIEKLQSKLSASEQEKNTLNSLLRMSIEQKVLLTQELEALEMEMHENNQDGGHHHNNGNKGGSRGGVNRGRGNASGGGRNPRSSRIIRSNNPDVQRQR